MRNAPLRQLRVLAAVGKHLNFARAAEELALSPPAVSMQIRELEEQVGMPLFDRTSRAVSLTTVGEYVLAHARRVLAAMRDAEDMVANLKGLKSGVLDVVMVSTAKYFVPRTARPVPPGASRCGAAPSRRAQSGCDRADDAPGRGGARRDGPPADGMVDARLAVRGASTPARDGT